MECNDQWVNSSATEARSVWSIARELEYNHLETHKGVSTEGLRKYQNRRRHILAKRSPKYTPETKTEAY